MSWLETRDSPTNSGTNKCTIPEILALKMNLAITNYRIEGKEKSLFLGVAIGVFSAFLKSRHLRSRDERGNIFSEKGREGRTDSDAF